MFEECKPSSAEMQNHRLQRRRLRLRSQLQATEQQHATNESISTLLSVIRYMNSVQDGDGLRIDNTYSRTDIDKQSRILNCHEEDIMNASLIAMKRLIASLIPAVVGSPHTQVAKPTGAESTVENT